VADEITVKLDTWRDRSHSFLFNKAGLFGLTSCPSSSIAPSKIHSSPEHSESGYSYEQSIIDFQLAQEYLKKSPVMSSGNIQLLDYFTDILPLDSSAANSKLMGQIKYA